MYWAPAPGTTAKLFAGSSDANVARRWLHSEAVMPGVTSPASKSCMFASH